MKDKKGFLKEFQQFISRGNVMDLAVGVIIGGAFSAITKSLVEDIISPVLGIFGGLNFDELSFDIMEGVTLRYGKFLTAVINFLIMALVIFVLIKLINGLMKRVQKEEEEAPLLADDKVCPYCKNKIPLEATRCGFCTSQLPDDEPADLGSDLLSPS